MTRRSSAGLVIVVAVALVGLVLGTRLFARANALERLSSDVGTVFQPGSTSMLRDDSAAIRTLRLLPSDLPAFAVNIGLTRTQFSQVLARYAHVKRGLAELPSAGSRIQGLVQKLNDETSRFAEADSIPTRSRAATAFPWFLLLAGIAGIAAGIWMLSPSRMGAATAMMVGAIVVAVPLATQLPAKAAGADEMYSNLDSVVTEQRLARAGTDLALMQSMDKELRSRLLPNLADRTGRTNAQLLAALKKAAPDVAAALNELPAALGRLDELTQTLRGSLGDFQTAAGTRYAWVTWSAVGLGFTLLLLGALSEAGEDGVRLRESDSYLGSAERAA